MRCIMLHAVFRSLVRLSESSEESDLENCHKQRIAQEVPPPSHIIIYIFIYLYIVSHHQSHVRTVQFWVNCVTM